MIFFSRACTKQADSLTSGNDDIWAYRASLYDHNASFTMICCDTFDLYQKNCRICYLDIAIGHILCQ